MIGTMVMVLIAVLSMYLQEEYLLDICLIYAMASFLAVIVLAKVYIGIYEEQHLENGGSKAEPEETATGADIRAGADSRAATDIRTAADTRAVADSQGGVDTRVMADTRAGAEKGE